MPTPVPGPTATPLLPPVTMEMLTFDSVFLPDSPRAVDIFLPPGYGSDLRNRYPVLYAQDGQDMGLVHLKSTLEALYAKQAIMPVIVVAVHASDDRLNEYGTAGILDYQGRGAHADLYTRMMIEEIMPALQARYRILSGPENAAVMGWSLGGLMAFDLAWNHPDLFGRAGVFSGSFWWHTDDTDLAHMLASRVAHNMVREGEKRPGLRFWFETGLKDETDDRDGDGIIDAVQDTRELVTALQAKGYAGAELELLELPDGQHNQETWGRALPEFLTWAFPPQ